MHRTRHHRETSRLVAQSVVGFVIAVTVVSATTAEAVTGTVSWDANSDTDLAGYVVHYGNQSTVYTTSVDVGNETSWAFSLPDGVSYCFAVQAYSTSGLRGQLSDEACIGPIATPWVLDPGDTSSAESYPISLQIQAGGNGLSYATTALPPGLTIDGASGLITGATPYTAVVGQNSGSYLVTVNVTDDNSDTASTQFTWTVYDTNRAPTVTALADQTHSEGGAVSLQILATDPDGDAVTSYTATGLPPGVDVHPSTGLITGTPPYTAAGSYNVTVTASDGQLSTGAGLVWTILDATPQTPVITQQPLDQAVSPDDVATFSLAAEGANPLTYQWQRDGVDIAGATSATYVTPPTTVADDGAIFHCIVSNAFGSDTSTAARLTVATSGLVAAYAFDEGSGTTVTDGSAHANHGTIGNAVRTTDGKYGAALSFDGTTGVTIPDAPSLDLTTAMTLETWVNPIDTVGWHDIIYRGYDNLFLSASAVGSLPWVGGSFPAGDTLTGTAVLPTNIWTHLAATWDGATLLLYVNGIEVASKPRTGQLATSGNPLEIGWDSDFGTNFVGTLDEVRIYNTARTAAQGQGCHSD